MIHTERLRAGRFTIPVEIADTGQRLFFKYDYNEALNDELRSMEGWQYHGYPEAPNRELAVAIFGFDRLCSIAKSQRNDFQLGFLRGKKPYARWDRYQKNPIELEFARPLMVHQKDMATHGLMVHYGIWAAEMGTGKTLSAVEVMERSGAEWWYIAPKSGLRAVDREFSLWDLKINPVVMTYNEVVKRMTNWVDGQPAPQGLICDESQRVKNGEAARSKAVKKLADGIRTDWGEEGYVLLLSGSPAPKSPLDWWFQCEIAQPGFLKEGTPNKFKLRLGLHELKESFAGGTFNERITWLDDARKCKHCGKFEEDIAHSGVDPSKVEHKWEASINEVEKLYRRMRGLVVVKFKKDCTDLPDMQYRTIQCKVLPSTLRTARLISATTSSAAQALILLRELSDGFQYVEVEDGLTTCLQCHGHKTVKEFKIKDAYLSDFEATGLPPFVEDIDSRLSEDQYRDKYYDRIEAMCDSCAGRGEVTKYRRDIQRVPCPKDDALRDVLDEHADVGRLVVFTGFEGSVERCVEIALAEKWAVVKWDGKGIKVYDADGTGCRVLPRRPPQQSPSKINSMDAEGAVDPLTMFQDDFDRFPRVCFVGNAGAAGTGLTLTASPSIFYYSNDFNAENRIQSEARIHRPGMDLNRGATIIDCLHLPTDQYVLRNLQNKRNLQSISMGELSSILNDSSGERVH